MAGGIGSRLWPLSTPDVPKQFIDVLGVGRSLIQLTVDRFAPVCQPENFWVVTGERYVDLVREQLPGIPASQILAEPEGRNTAPCIAYASWKIACKDPEANIVVTPADALVLKTEVFAETIAKALEFTAERSAIVTVGIAPTRPETGYGYIHASEALHGQLVKVSEFKEKPSLDTAIEYLEDGHYFWNAGKRRHFRVERTNHRQRASHLCPADCRGHGPAGSLLFHGAGNGAAPQAFPHL